LEADYFLDANSFRMVRNILLESAKRVHLR